VKFGLEKKLQGPRGAMSKKFFLQLLPTQNWSLRGVEHRAHSCDRSISQQQLCIYPHLNIFIHQTTGRNSKQ